ncbi:tetratricopeptide repeat protein [Aureispira sp. CCB-QB1]|uniref:tetratricopeptide repeat protein n=1 Tax=Aureispira sp. CCB-QB1 TaxID=1313421 RepID=UPI0012DF2371|nr:tetratricopeptide repeat protein [Aureispira sp. CCB-QB1]
MLRLSGYLLLLMLFLTACTSNNKDEPKIGADGFPEFTEEQLQEMIKNHPKSQQPMPAQESSNQIIEKMESFLAKDPDDIATNYNLAKLHYQKYMEDSLVEAIQKALPYYNKVIALQADYEEGRPYYNRMLCYLNTGEYDAALNDLDRFVAINQNRTPVNHESMRAEILFQKGLEVEACAVYQKALVRYQQDSLPIHNEKFWNKRCSN